MSRLVLLLPILLLAACGSDAPEPEQREVERPERRHDYFPIEATDDALRTEADVAMATIYRRLQMATATGADRNTLAVELEGPLTEASMQRLGIEPAQLAGTWYQPSDYRLEFNGGEVVITAGNPGTRGYKQAKYPWR
jgi:hypothetical protein